MPPPKSPKPAPKPPPAWLIPALLGIAALFLVGLFSTEFSDTDAWWHLKTGEYIVHRHRLPYPDPFAYTTAMAKPSYAGEAETQRFNLTHEWLAQAAMYLVEALGGLGAVVLCKALLLAAACRSRGLGCAPAQRVVAMGSGGGAGGFLRRHLFRARPAEHSELSLFGRVHRHFENRRRLWLLPVLALVWANCHGGFFLGWVICGAYAADALLSRAPDAKRILAFSAAAILISGLNPNGFRVVSTLASYRSSPMTATLIEWSRPGLWGEPHAFFLLLYGSAAMLAISWRACAFPIGCSFLHSPPPHWPLSAICR